MKGKARQIVFTIVAIVLIAFAIIPTPDDVTVISPVVAFSAGVALLRSAYG